MGSTFRTRWSQGVAASQQIDDLYMQFEAAWKQDEPPDIVAFIGKAVAVMSLPAARDLAIALIAADMEYRWQRYAAVPKQPSATPSSPAQESQPVVSLPTQPRIADYLRLFPAFGPLEELPISLIAHEYLVRREYGDPLDVDEYLRDFPSRSPELRANLCEIDGDARDLALGSVVGKYEILQVIGKGAMGTVYRAQDACLGRQVALKVPHGLDDSELRDRFLRETIIAAAIHHPNICPIWDAGEIDRRCYIAMPLIKGETLEEKRRRGPMDVASVVNIVSKLAEALDEVHRAGIVHRDVKPSNVMINEREEPLLVDLGLARRIREVTPLTLSGAVIGTPFYMSPEQVRAEPLDGRTDIFGLGVVLYQLLTGELPFDHSNLGELFFAIQSTTPTNLQSLRSDLDPGLNEVCQIAMNKSPEDRYQSGAELCEAIRRYAFVGRNRHEKQDSITIPLSSDDELSLDGEKEFREEYWLGRGESIVIDSRFNVVVIDLRGNGCRLGIEAPKYSPVHRSEVQEALRREGRNSRDINDCSKRSDG